MLYVNGVPKVIVTYDSNITGVDSYCKYRSKNVLFNDQNGETYIIQPWRNLIKDSSPTFHTEIDFTLCERYVGNSSVPNTISVTAVPTSIRADYNNRDDDNLLSKLKNPTPSNLPISVITNNTNQSPALAINWTTDHWQINHGFVDAHNRYKIFAYVIMNGVNNVGTSIGDFDVGLQIPYGRIENGAEVIESSPIVRSSSVHDTEFTNVRTNTSTLVEMSVSKTIIKTFDFNANFNFDTYRMIFQQNPKFYIYSDIVGAKTFSLLEYGIAYKSLN